MPVLIKNYTWRQTEDAITIHVPLTVHSKNVDLFTTDNYIKVNLSPFILELFLWANIIDNESTCTFNENQVVFSLRKVEKGLEWPNIEVDGLTNKEKRKYRNRILDCARMSIKKREEANSEKRQHLQREAVKAQIDLDTAILNKINAMRDAHRREAMKQFEDWRSKMEKPILKNNTAELQENRKAYRPSLKWFKDDIGAVRSRTITDEETVRATIINDNEKLVSKELEEKQIRNIDEFSKAEKEKDEVCEMPESRKIVNDTESIETTLDINKTSCSEDSESDDGSICTERSVRKLDSTANDKTLKKSFEKKNKESKKDLIDKISSKKLRRINNIFDEPSKSIPLPRKSTTINVTFSERHFPTPARESYRLEEEDWLTKQADARRKIGFVTEDLRPEERDPQWLKDKGDEFFKNGNYLGAISAYSHGIKISEKMVSLYVNRSAAHYAVGNYQRCAEDCSKALELMQPKCENNRESRAKCHARLGAALCKLSAPQHGIPELEAALKLTPGNDSIKRDILVAKRYFSLKD